MARREADTPASLQEFSRRVGRALRRLERQIETAGRDARRSWARMLRRTSHQLGRLEAEGERRWRVQSRKARHETARMLHRLESAIEPPVRVRKKKARRRARGELGGSGI